MVLLSLGCVLLLRPLVPFGGAAGKVPHSIFQFLLARIILVPQHGQSPRIAGEIALVKSLSSSDRRAGKIPGNAKKFNALVGGDGRALVVAFHVRGAFTQKLFMAG